MTAEIHHLSTGERVHRIPPLDAWAEPDGPQTPRTWFWPIMVVCAIIGAVTGFTIGMWF